MRPTVDDDGLCVSNLKTSRRSQMQEQEKKPAFRITPPCQRQCLRQTSQGFPTGESGIGRGAQDQTL